MPRKKYNDTEVAEVLKQIAELLLDENAEAVVDGTTILEMRNLAKDVPVATDVLNYAMNLVAATHPELKDASDTAKKYIKKGKLIQ